METSYPWLKDNERLRYLESQELTLRKSESDRKIEAEAGAPYLFQVTDLGHFLEDAYRPGYILQMDEKPKDWPMLKRMLSNGTHQNWWDWGVSRKAALELIDLEEQHKFMQKDMDFSINFLEAVSRQNTIAAKEAWRLARPEERMLGELDWQFELAQAVKARLGPVEYLHGAYFIDVGKIPNFHKAFLGRLPHEELNIVIRALLRREANVVCVPNQVREALRSGALRLDPRAVLAGG
jgi:hypothetical protein